MKKVEKISAAELSSYPEADIETVDNLLLEEIQRNHKKIIVLDDDPTGVQTVHDISVYTDWSEESVKAGFAEENSLFYILTNSRGLTDGETTKVHQDIAAVVSKVSQERDQDFVMISRCDSTLRGHYPLETEILKEGFEQKLKIKIDGEILCPFFKEGGRFVIDNILYVKYGQDLIPAGQTEYSKDKTFGYTSSDICDYVEEKTQGRFKAEQVITVSMEDLRAVNIDKITEQLMNTKDFNKIVVNATSSTDVKVFVIAFYRAIAGGKHFIFRTAAAMVKEIGGISDRPFLKRIEMIEKETENGGIVVIGSHTQKTTSQLEELKKLEGISCVEFNSDLVLDDAKFQTEIAETIKKLEEIILNKQTAVVYTRRKLLSLENDTKEQALIRSVKISEAVQSLVGNLSVEPAFVVAKGGITSSDVGTKALRVKKARVMGQIRPGIPVWQTGEESKFPHIPYIIFPGNVGEVETLREVVEILIG